MRRLAPVLTLALALTACGAEQEPDARPSPTTQTPSPTAAPTLPPAATDRANAKQALLTPAELGPPWTVRTSGDETDEMCPGQQGAAVLAPARGAALVRLTGGTQDEGPFGSFGVRAYAFGEEQAWRDAIATAAKGCASWVAKEVVSGTLEVVTPPVVAGADEVHAHIERIYRHRTKDKKTKELYYVRHYYEARSGRIVTSVEYTFLPSEGDPTGADLAVSRPLLERQLAKVRTEFGEAARSTALPA